MRKQNFPTRASLGQIPIPINSKKSIRYEASDACSHILNITNLCGTRNRVKYGAFATI